MKKIFTLITATLCATALWAQGEAHVSTSSELISKMKDAAISTIVLDADIELLTDPQMTGTKTLDMNGHRITTEYTMSFTNLTIDGNGTYVYKGSYWAFSSKTGGARLNIKNGTFLNEEKTGRCICIGPEGTDADEIIIDGGYFEFKNSVIHVQGNSSNKSSVTLNGGVFVTTGSNGVISNSTYANVDFTLNKCVLANCNPQTSSLYYLYGSTTSVTIPAHSTYVEDGSYHGDIAEAKTLPAGPSSKVLYVGKSTSDFSLFNLMGNSDASTNVYNIASGAGAYGHNAHSAVFVKATPASGYAKVSFTSPASATVRNLGNNIYCITPYTPGMTVSAKGEKVTVDNMTITTKTGCIPAVGEKFWSMKTNSTECKQVLSWSDPDAFYINTTFWREGETQLGSSSTCEAEKDYELYMHFYLNDGYEFADNVTVTVDGNEARLNKSFGEIYYTYSTKNLAVDTIVSAASTPVKHIVNGRLVIDKNGKRFNLAGAQL